MASVAQAPNPFESGARKVIPAVLIYLQKDHEVLMLHRNTRPEDHHNGKWNGLGGKLELGESPLEAAARELKEESGLRIATDAFKVLGVLQFPNFKAAKNEDWMVYVLTAETSDAGELEGKRTAEGQLHWVSRGRLLELNLWDGDRHFLEYVLEGRPFVGTFWYEGRELKRYWIQALSGHAR